MTTKSIEHRYEILLNVLITIYQADLPTGAFAEVQRDAWRRMIESALQEIAGA